MKSKNSGLSTIGVGFIILMVTIWSYLNDESFNHIPLIIFSIIFIITGIFQTIKCYNKTFYFGVITLLLVVMWINGFIQPVYPGATQITTLYYYLTLGILTIASGWIAYDFINTHKIPNDNETLR